MSNSGTHALADRLVALLADGEWHTGPALASALGVTRARVSQQAGALRALGVDVFAVNGRGYRLRTPLDLLDERSIRAALGPNAGLLAELDVLGRVDSTNAWLLRVDDGRTRACVAEYQSAGRGRHSRGWTSPFAANLYFSLAHVIETPRAPLGTLGLAVGVALVERLARLGARGVGLKWPNDLLVDNAKLGGILIEHRGEASGRSRVVIGVGLNVLMARDQAHAVDQPWTRLADCIAELPPRSALAGELVDAVIDALWVFQANGFAPFHARWQRLDVSRNRAVTVDDGQSRRTGTARGIGADGALQVEMDGRIAPVYAGDVSMRIEP